MDTDEMEKALEEREKARKCLKDWKQFTKDIHKELMEIFPPEPQKPTREIILKYFKKTVTLIGHTPSFWEGVDGEEPDQEKVQDFVDWYTDCITEEFDRAEKANKKNKMILKCWNERLLKTVPLVVPPEDDMSVVKLTHAVYYPMDEFEE